MRKKLVCAFIIATLSFVSCDFVGETIDGNGNFTSEIRHVGHISKIKVTGAMDVFINSGEPNIKVEGDENILRYVETKVDGDWLEIKTKDHVNIHSSSAVKVYVTMQDINALKVTGSGNITSNNKLSSLNNMSFSVSGSGNIRADINAPAVDANITGSGNMYLKGETRNVDIEITGSGNYDSPDLKAENAVVKISGSGDAKSFAEAHLKASIAGSGDIKFKGNAQVDKTIAGSGSITALH